jgi:SAM-dependent methyltransferase
MDTRVESSSPGAADLLAHMFQAAPLKTEAERVAATALVRLLGLPSHHDAQKNWDTIKCLFHVLALGDRQGPVLDVGSSRAVILQWLASLGYEALHACDILDVSGRFEGTEINFSVQDLAATDYATGYFQAITSISVIEHGVTPNDYFREMSRLLRPRGLLLTSTDYWSEPVECAGIYPYGVGSAPMHVFGPSEIESLVEVAREHRLELSSPLDLSTVQKAVRWERVDREYTFMFLSMRKCSD